MRQRPTAALREESDPYTNWESLDYKLQEAMNMLDRDTCKSCSNPAWLCHSADNRIDFIVKTGVCYAQAEIKDYEDNPGNPKLEAGEFHYAVAAGVENDDGTRDPLPSRAEAMAKID